MRIQLLTHPGCASASATRERLVRLLALTRADAGIEEVDVTAANAPEHLRGWGSPTVLVDGEDVAGEKSPSGPGCRLYRDADGRLAGVPSEALITSMLHNRGHSW